MSEENDLDEFCESIVMEICSKIEPDSIKPFLYMLEDRIKEVLIEEGEIDDPKDINELKEEKIKVKDLGNGFFEIEDCEVSDDELSDTDSDKD